MNYVIYKALDEMFVGGILRFILPGVEKYACRRDADQCLCACISLLCHKID